MRTRNQDQIYGPTEAAPKQKHFPHRRTSVKGKVPKRITLSKKQSTLTQIDFVSTPRTSDEIVGVSSDESDYELENTRPVKRRRKVTSSSRSKSQSSLTQWERQYSGCSRLKQATDGDGFEIWQDNASEGTPKEPNGSSRNGSNGKRSPEIGDSKEDDQRQARKREVSSIPQTPSKIARTEIPSSQSPLSGKLSTRRTIRFKNAERSPLKSMDPNERLSRPNLGIKSILKSGAKPRQSPAVKRISVHTEATSQQPAEIGSTPHSRAAADPVKPKTRQKLQRVSTIQDSDNDDLAMDAETEDDRGESDNEQNTYDPAHSALDRDAIRFLQTQPQTQTQMLQHSPALRLHVSNSTCSDDEDDLLHEETTVDYEPAPSIREASTAGAPLPTEATDPTSLPKVPSKNSIGDSTTHEEVIDTIPSSQPPLEPSKTHTILVPSSPPQLHSTTTLSATTAPVLHISQTSTVLPTQLSQLPPPTTRPTKSTTKNSNDTMPASSPPKPPPYTFSLNANLSSSPLPLPPWSSQDLLHHRPQPRTYARNNGTTDEEQGPDWQQANTLGSLMDFSLPPPPPPLSMGSDSTQGPAKTSRKRVISSSDDEEILGNDGDDDEDDEL